MGAIFDENGVEIMANIPAAGQDSIAAQREMFRRAGAEHGLTVAVLAQRCPVPLSTLKSWAGRSGAPVAMPAWAVGQIGEAGVPDDLLTLLAAPFGRHVGTSDVDIDLRELAVAALEFGNAFVLALANGRIGPREEAFLRQQALSLVAHARKGN